MTRPSKNLGASGIRTRDLPGLEADALTTRPTRWSLVCWQSEEELEPEDKDKTPDEKEPLDDVALDTDGDACEEGEKTATA